MWSRSRYHLRRRTNAQCSDLVPGLAQDFESVAVECEDLTRFGDRLCLVDHKARDRRRFLVRQAPIHLTVQVTDSDRAVHVDRAVGLRAYGRFVRVMLVRDLADNLLEDILKRDQTLHLAVLVDDERDLRLAS